MEADLSPSDTHSSDSINTALGVRLKTLREAFGLSQRELAKKAGVTNSNISMIEQGLVSPSVHSLSRILNAFPISLTDFFSCRLMHEQSPVIPAQILSTNAYTSSEGILIHQYQHPSMAQSISLKRQSFRLGSATLMQTAKQDIVGWLISGELNLQLSSDVYLVRAGDGILIKQEQLYQFTNVRSEIAELILASPNTAR